MTEAAELRLPNVENLPDMWTDRLYAEKKPKIVVFRPVKSDRFLVNDNGQLRVEKVADITTDKRCQFSEQFTVENYTKKYEFRSESNDKLYLGVTDQKTFELTEKNPRSNTYFQQLKCSKYACMDTEFTKTSQCQRLLEGKHNGDMSTNNKRTRGETDESFISNTDSCNPAVQLFLKPWGTGLVVLYQDGNFEVVEQEDGLCGRYNGFAKISL
uniref:Uncharacterized protein n=2 Tax=Magallana gigas TaxID=29159 RepID=A0A8W8IH19_MAGGI|nr:uncharacterized protein LOC105328089 [Crassostrea gigas]